MSDPAGQKSPEELRAELLAKYGGHLRGFFLSVFDSFQAGFAADFLFLAHPEGDVFDAVDACVKRRGHELVVFGKIPGQNGCGLIHDISLELTVTEIFGAHGDLTGLDILRRDTGLTGEGQELFH